MPQRIAYLTDLHLDDQYPKDCGANTFQNWERVLQDLAAQAVDKVVVGGDFGEPNTTAYFFESLAAYQDLHLTLGNHDQFSNIAPHFPRAQQQLAQQQLYYSFLEEGYKYIFLDSSAGSLSAVQRTWLQEELTTDLPILLFNHYPIFEVAHCLVDELHPLKGRLSLQQLLIKSGLDISIFCGHYHLLHEQVHGSVKQYITPATSVQFDIQAEKISFNADSFGYRIIEVGAQGVHSEVLSFSPAS